MSASRKLWTLGSSAREERGMRAQNSLLEEVGIALGHFRREGGPRTSCPLVAVRAVNLNRRNSCCPSTETHRVSTGAWVLGFSLNYTWEAVSVFAACDPALKVKHLPQVKGLVVALVSRRAVTAAPSVREHPVWDGEFVASRLPFLVSLALPDSDLAGELQAHLELDLFPGGAIFQGRPEDDGSYLTFPGHCPGPGLQHCPAGRLG